jgi:pimeloyl-ACP methyl ester carboxylesterase
MNHPEVVERLAILNAAHPRKLLQGLHHPGQLRRSWYFFFFDLPELPESVVRADDWRFFRHFLRDAVPGASTPQDMDRYVEAWSQPGAATAMINYYRSSVRESPKRAEAQIRPVRARTLVIWGRMTAISARSLPSRITATCRTWTGSSGCPRRTGCITTSLSGLRSCLPGSSPSPLPAGSPESRVR